MKIWSNRKTTMDWNQIAVVVKAKNDGKMWKLIYIYIYIIYIYRCR